MIFFNQCCDTFAKVEIEMHRRFQTTSKRAPRSSVRWLVAVVVLALAISGTAGAAETDVERLEARIAELERTIATLRAEGEDDPRITEIERAVEVLGQEIEALKVGDAVDADDAGGGRYGLGPAASRVYGVGRGVSIGGYGEMLYENFDSKRQDGAEAGKTDQIDFLRAIVYLGYKFDDRIVFNSEIEFEHASTGKDGEVSVEFAYLDFLLRDAFNVRVGMFLAPLGFVNEWHEPPVFLGARRPYVEQNIIPSTWRENGAGVFGDFGKFTYRAYVGTGLTSVAGTASGADGFSASGVRGGRQSGSKAAFEDPGLFGRLDYAPVEGLTFGVSGYTGDTGQGARTPTTDLPVGGATTISDAHVDWRWRGLQARGVYARTTIDDAELINEAQDLVGAESVGERQYGWYAEVGYDVLAHRSNTRQALIPYVRHERYDTQDEVPEGFAKDPSRNVTVTTVGVAWKPIVNVVVKVDYNKIENEAETGVDQINAAIGFLF